MIGELLLMTSLEGMETDNSLYALHFMTVGLREEMARKGFLQEQLQRILDDAEKEVLAFLDDIEAKKMVNTTFEEMLFGPKDKIPEC
jgi:hypothetical protein